MSLLRQWHNIRVTQKSQELATYRMRSGLKPSKVSGRKFELFHRSRPLWIAIQAAALIGVAVWTIRNYIHVIQSL